MELFANIVDLIVANHNEEKMTETEYPTVFPFETEFFSDLFEQYGHTSKAIGSLPIVKIGSASIEIGPVCIIGLEPFEDDNGQLVGGGRRYMLVKPKQELADFIQTHLRIAKNDTVHFKVKIKKGKALVVAVQGQDPGPSHWIAEIRSDSIPGEEDLL